MITTLRVGSIVGAAVAALLIAPPSNRNAALAAGAAVVACAVVASSLLFGTGFGLAGRAPTRWAIARAVAQQALIGAVAAINPAALPFVAAALAINFLYLPGGVGVHLMATAAQLAGPLVAAGREGWRLSGIGIVGALAVFDLAKAAAAQVLEADLTESHRQVRAIVDQSKAILWCADDVEHVAVSAHVQPILGWPLSSWSQPDFLSTIVHVDDRAKLRELITAGASADSGAADRAAQLETTLRVRTSAGPYAHLLARLLPAVHRDGKTVLPARGVFLDITTRVDAELSVRRYAEVTSHSPVGCVIVEVGPVTGAADPSQMLIKFGNPVALESMMIDERRLEDGVPLTSVLRPATADLLARMFQDVARTGNAMSAERMTFPEAPDVWCNIRADRLFDGSLAVTFEDVTSQVRAEERLRHQALHDALTGLPNRVQLDEALRDSVIEAERVSHTVALLLMDLTQFKEVNDAMGHRAGDQLLVEIAHRLETTLAGSVRLLARLGGDEFAIVSHSITGEDEAIELAKHALAALERPFEVDGIPLQSSANIGIALCPNHGTNADSLLKMADIAMYRAKRTGQGLELYSTDRDQSSLRRVTLLGELRRAMAKGELQLRYQPAIDLKTGRVAKVEALVRWDHRHHGLMMPVEFIELAESSGMIHPLTRWIIVEASRGANQMHAWDYPLVVSANISVRNLQDPDLVSFFELLSRTDEFHPERLELEITETELMDDPVRAFEILDRLRTIGLSAAIDDFGIGHSSLAYLKHMPVNHLKIDRGFITTISSDVGDAAIVRSTIDLAHSLNLNVTAEGVPNQETLRMLAKFGCDYACGFYLAEPVPLESLPSTIAEINARMPSLLGIDGIQLDLTELEGPTAGLTVPASAHAAIELPTARLVNPGLTGTE